jgi:hypothetical protein
MCQLENIKDMGIRDPFSLKIRQLLFSTLVRIKIPQLKRNITRLSRLIKCYLMERGKNCSRGESLKDSIDSASLFLKQGDIVRIRSKDQILQTLDDKNKFEGCSFMKEMWQYCGTQQTVIKRVDYFFDESKYRMRKARNIVLLDGLFCSGQWPVFNHRCDRVCYLFWKEAWLEKVE